MPDLIYSTNKPTIDLKNYITSHKLVKKTKKMTSL